MTNPAATKKASAALKPIEGRVRGAGTMIKEDHYGIDILGQIEAVRAALANVKAELFRQRQQHYLQKALASKNSGAQERVVEERVGIFRR
jgi:DNA-binding FrmR family transcriptional regulator